MPGQTDGADGANDPEIPVERWRQQRPFDSSDFLDRDPPAYDGESPPSPTGTPSSDVSEERQAVTIMSQQKADKIMRDYVESTHFFDEATGELVDRPAETPPDQEPAPRSV